MKTKLSNLIKIEVLPKDNMFSQHIGHTCMCGHVCVRVHMCMCVFQFMSPLFSYYIWFPLFNEHLLSTYEVLNVVKHYRRYKN